MNTYSSLDPPLEKPPTTLIATPRYRNIKNALNEVKVKAITDASLQCPSSISSSLILLRMIIRNSDIPTNKVI